MFPGKKTILCAGLVTLFTAGFVMAADKPNVLFVMFDDLNDLGIPGAAPKTPNLDAFRETAVLFKQAQCAVPLCNPSRCALLSGVSPAKSQVFHNKQNPWKPKQVFGHIETLPQCFKENGYRTITAGKIFHERDYFSPAQLDAMFDDHQYMNGKYGPFPSHPALPDDKIDGNKWLNFEEWTGPDSDFSDVVNADKIVKELGITDRNEPFFISFGLYRPHTPYTAPKRFFEMYSDKDIILPPYLENDLDDVPEIARQWALKSAGNQQKIMTGKYWKDLLRAYYASLSFADWNFGRVMTALKNSPYADNTIVIVCGDNGFHNGEKDHWGKQTLWEKATHVPLMMRVPGMTPSDSTCNGTVSLLDLYPTLVDLCGLTSPAHTLDGQTIRGLLQDPGSAQSDHPVLTCFLPGNYAVCDEHYRYIRYEDGTEELYDHRKDPNEWTNLASNPEYANVKHRLAVYIPNHSDH